MCGHVTAHQPMIGGTLGLVGSPPRGHALPVETKAPKGRGVSSRGVRSAAPLPGQPWR
jgi:hypothetical protein